MAKNNGSSNGALLDVPLPEGAKNLAIQYIPRDLIDPDPLQPREEPDAELKESIKRSGILQAITVRVHPNDVRRFMIVDGERRWKGSEGAQHLIPCVVRADQADERARLVTQLTANTGKPLAPAEEARAFARLGELSGLGLSELAEQLGRPRSTISDRLSLLDVGPWINLIEAGEISVSHVIRVIVPLRGVPEDYHRQAIDKIRKDYRWSKNGISLQDFERLVDVSYRSYMYPLQKGREKGFGVDKRPLFETRNHNKECDCGRIKFKIDYSSKRECCGNPDWWRPLHRKAIAEQKKKGGKKKSSHGRANEGPTFHLPAGHKTATASYGDAPKGTVLLSNESGHWDPWSLVCDPAELEFSPESLVLVKPQYGSPKVASNAKALIDSARAKWRERWIARRRVLVAELLVKETEAADELVSGEGTGAILGALIEHYPHELVDCAIAAEINMELHDDLVFVPAERWQRNVDQRVVKSLFEFASRLTKDQKSKVLSIFATYSNRGLDSPFAQVNKEQNAALNKIASRQVPWTKAPKSETAEAKPAKKTGKSKTARVKKNNAVSQEDDAFDQGPPPKVTDKGLSELRNAAFVGEAEEDEILDDELAEVAETH